MNTVPCLCMLTDVHLPPATSHKLFVCSIRSSYAQWNTPEIWGKSANDFQLNHLLCNFKQYLHFLNFSFYVKKESRYPPYWINMSIRDHA